MHDESCTLVIGTYILIRDLVKRECAKLFGR